MSDSSYESVSLLLPMKGADSGVVFTDYSKTPKTITVTGGSKTVTSKSKFYGSSGYFDGTGDYITVPFSSADALGTGDFTIEFWCWWEGLKQVSHFDFRGGTGSTSRPMVGVVNGETRLRYYTNATDRLATDSGSLIVEQWQHIALVRDDGVTRIYIDGVSSGGSYTDSTDYTVSTYGTIGAQYNDTSNFNGYIQDFRITIGVARYTGTFTPPLQMTGVLSGVVLDVVGEPAARTVICTQRSLPTTRVSTTISSAVDGSYSFDKPCLEYYIVCLDDDAGTQFNSQILDRLIPG